MIYVKFSLARRPYVMALVGAMLFSLCVVNDASAQRVGGVGMINAGTTITVRTNEEIKANDTDGRVFSGVVDQDVMDRNGNVAIPRRADVELIVKRISDNEVALDLESVMVNGQRYGIEADNNVISSERREGLGANDRTGKYVGGGALLGAVIGAITGGGKGAAIGAGAGAAAGAGAQILTRGHSINVPSESLLTFRLAQPLRAGVVESGFTQGSRHYHSGYANAPVNSPAYQQGLRAGRSDFDRSLRFNARGNPRLTAQERRDYEMGYSDGYKAAPAPTYGNRQKPGYSRNDEMSVHIGSDRNVSWESPDNSRLYVQVDNEAPKLFASGRSGSQMAPWIEPGHTYVFILRDLNGNELARDQMDTRMNRRRN